MNFVSLSPILMFEVFFLGKECIGMQGLVFVTFYFIT